MEKFEKITLKDVKIESCSYAKKRFDIGETLRLTFTSGSDVPSSVPVRRNEDDDLVYSVGDVIHPRITAKFGNVEGLVEAMHIAQARNISWPYAALKRAKADIVIEPYKVDAPVRTYVRYAVREIIVDATDLTALVSG